MSIKRIIRHMAAAAAVCTAAACLGGCSLSALTAENVMAPPQASGDGAQLQAVLEEALGPQITLRYPRSGEHRSAVVRADVDGDMQEEAIVFYRPATQSEGARMVLLDTDSEGEWQLLSEFADAEGEIDRVVFGDINGDGALDIITGWRVHSDYCTFHVHSCIDGGLAGQGMSSEDAGAYALSSYKELAVGDFDADGTDELLTVTMSSADSSGAARLLKWFRRGQQSSVGSLYPVGELTLSEGAADYVSSAAGNLKWNQWGLAVDSRRTDGSYGSEMIYWDREQERLVSPLNGEGTALLTRTLATESCDVDADGFIEIPDDCLLPGYSQNTAGGLYLTDWYCFASTGCIKDFSAIMRPDSGYYIILPDRWQGVVTARPDTESHALRFYLADSGKGFAQELMSIRVFTLDEWEEEDSIGWNEQPTAYTELCRTEYYVYAVQINSPPSGLSISYDSVLRYFTLME